MMWTLIGLNVSLTVVYHFFYFFLENNTNNIKWKRLLKIITLLQDSRFGKSKRGRQKPTHLHKSIYLYTCIHRQDVEQGNSLGGEIVDTEPLDMKGTKKWASTHLSTKIKKRTSYISVLNQTRSWTQWKVDSIFIHERKHVSKRGGELFHQEY